MAVITKPQIPDGRLFIGGARRDSSDGKTGPTFNPATEEEITQVARATESDVNDAVEAAHGAFESGEWRGMGPHGRERVLHEIAGLIEGNADELAALESMDVGKPVQFVRSFDIQFLADLFRFCAGVAGGQLGGATRPVAPSASGQMPLAYTRREPLGVVAAITPFNFPMVLSATKIAPALAASKSLVIGDPLDLDTTYGPQIDAVARDNCAKYVAIGSEEGARLVLGGEPMSVNGKGYFFQPTIMANVDNRSRLAQEEIFGPVLAVTPFDTEEETIALANDSEYGLAAGLQTQNLGRAHRVAHALEAGLIWVNTWGQFDSVLPFGGYTASGMGRELGLEAFESYTQTKSVYVDLN
jgi:acyl-CoA reductase-like NAD-dependent aldehyde dehydrogenase